MIAVLQHKPNVFNDLSGWSPRYIPPALLHEAAGRLNAKFLFGSDYPFITPERWLSDFMKLPEWSDEARQNLLWRNGQRLLSQVVPGFAALHFEWTDTQRDQRDHTLDSGSA
jgi:predicted TIM-barrel fold metal-dependent hydrolase